MKIAKGNLPEVLSVFSLLIFSFTFCYYCGLRGFFPLDQSIVFDGAWRIIQGQVPFKDFVCPIGPLSFLYQAGIFCLLGTSIRTYALGAAVLNAVACAAVFLILKKLFPKSEISPFAGALLSAAFFFPPAGTTYPDQMSLLLCMLSLLAIVAVPAKSANPETSHTAALVFSAGFAVAAAFLTKQNFAVFFAPLPLVLIAERNGAGSADFAKEASIFAAGALFFALLFAGWLLLFSDSADFARHFFEIPSQEGLRRIFSAGKIFKGRADMLNILLVLFSGCAALCHLIRTRRDGKPDPRLRQAADIAGYLAAYTFIMLKTVNNNAGSGWACVGLLGGIGLELGLAGSRRISARFAKMFQIAFMVFLAILAVRGISAAWNRETHDFPQGTGFEVLQTPETIKGLAWGNPTFAGRIGGEACGINSADLSKLVGYLAESDAKFFVFCDFTALYGLTGKNSPQPLLWFHKGLTYSGKYDEKLDKWIVDSLVKNSIDTVIFEEASWFGSYRTMDDFPLLKSYIFGNFARQGGIGIYNIYRLK